MVVSNIFHVIYSRTKRDNFNFLLITHFYLNLALKSHTLVHLFATNEYLIWVFQIGVPKSGPRVLQEPIDVTVMSNGNLVVSDHADQGVKIFTSKGQYLRTVRCKGLSNIAGVATNEERQIVVAGTDRQCVTRQDEEGKLLNVIPNIPLEKKPQETPSTSSAFGFVGPPDKDGYVNVTAASRSMFEHPYSVATNPLTGDIIVGDDYRQLVTAVSRDGKVLWKYCPHGAGARAFFPSSICVDPQGYVFIADLYNEKVYMLDSSGKYLRTLLARGDGLKGGPGAIAVDGSGLIAVADEEKSLKLFQYAENGFAVTKRFSVCPDVS